jgi:hypothetical protein
VQHLHVAPSGLDLLGRGPLGVRAQGVGARGGLGHLALGLAGGAGADGLGVLLGVEPGRLGLALRAEDLALALLELAGALEVLGGRLLLGSADQGVGLGPGAVAASPRTPPRPAAAWP